MLVAVLYSLRMMRGYANIDPEIFSSQDNWDNVVIYVLDCIIDIAKFDFTSILLVETSISALL